MAGMSCTAPMPTPCGRCTNGPAPSSATGAASCVASRPTPRPRRNNVLTAPTTGELTITVKDEVLVRASLEHTFDSVLAQMGRLNETPDGKPFPMTLEARPGGRWFRDLGGND